MGYNREELIELILSKSDAIKLDCCLLDADLVADLMVMVFSHGAKDAGKSVDTKVADSKLISSLLRVGLVDYNEEISMYTIKKKDGYSELVDRILECLAV